MHGANLNMRRRRRHRSLPQPSPQRASRPPLLLFLQTQPSKSLRPASLSRLQQPRLRLLQMPPRPLTSQRTPRAMPLQPPAPPPSRPPLLLPPRLGGKLARTMAFTPAPFATVAPPKTRHAATAERPLSAPAKSPASGQSVPRQV